MQPEMVITDLDGTFLNSAGKISRKNRTALDKLAETDIITVIATGRSLYSLKQVVPADLPLDFVVFSSGAGIYDWHNDQIIEAQNLPPNLVKQSVLIFHKHNINYFVHKPIPRNHYFDYYLFDKKDGTDAWQRIQGYCNLASPISNIEKYCFQSSCQVIGIAESSTKMFRIVKENLPTMSVIRTTSPIDKKSLWIEVFAQNVSKAAACQQLCQKLQIAHQSTLGIGNDYNDLDMLEWAGESFLMDNAPNPLKDRFEVIESNDKNGFGKLLSRRIFDHKT